jgi:ribosomal protein S1
VSGEVVSLVDYGAFIALEEGVEGLVHVSEMSWTKKVKNPRSVLEIGQEVDVVVSEVDTEKRRLSLSLRATEPNPWDKVAEEYFVGSRVHGVVRNLTDFGAFVEIIPGVDGLVHISDMSWTRRINHPSEVVAKAQEVDAVITAIDPVNQRISLSMKELLPNEWEVYANTHGVGDIVTGSATNVTDFGVFIELAPGVEGLCHISEIEREGGDGLKDLYVTGQKVRCRILRIDWNENRIGLSMHGVTQDGASEEFEANEETAATGSGTAMAAALSAAGLVTDEPEADDDTAAAAPAEVEETELEAAEPEAAEPEAAEPEAAKAQDEGAAEPEETAPEAEAAAADEAPEETASEAGEVEEAAAEAEEAVPEEPASEAAEVEETPEEPEPAEAEEAGAESEADETEDDETKSE